MAFGAATLSPEGVQETIRYASVESFQAAYVTLLLLPVFGLIWVFDHRRGGHQAEIIGEPGALVTAKEV